jgi:putative oxidoreductase
LSSPRYTHLVWPLFRVVIGLLFACHGLAGLFGVLGGRGGTGESVPVGTWPGWYAAVIQLVCGVLVMVGLATRPAAILASGSMAYAYFVVHQRNGLLPIENGGVTPALYAWTFLIIAAFGPGAWSLDGLISSRREPATAPAQAQAPEKVTEAA